MRNVIISVLALFATMSSSFAAWEKSEGGSFKSSSGTIRALTFTRLDSGILEATVHIGNGVTAGEFMPLFSSFNHVSDSFLGFYVITLTGDLSKAVSDLVDILQKFADIPESTVTAMKAYGDSKIDPEKAVVWSTMEKAHKKASAGLDALKGGNFSMKGFMKAVKESGSTESKANKAENGKENAKAN